MTDTDSVAHDDGYPLRAMRGVEGGEMVMAFVTWPQFWDLAQEVGVPRDRAEQLFVRLEAVQL